MLRLRWAVILENAVAIKSNESGKSRLFAQYQWQQKKPLYDYDFCFFKISLIYGVKRKFISSRVSRYLLRIRSLRLLPFLLKIEKTGEPEVACDWIIKV